MLTTKIKFNLQLFGEGGDGAGDGAGAAEGAETSGADIPAFIPEKAKKMYAKAQARMQAAQPAEQPAEQTGKPDRVSYADLIKSDEYKDEHKAYMDKTIGDRFKKYKGIEESYGKAKDILDIVAGKYGVDVNSETFLDDLRAKAEEDDSYYEEYAMKHDISTDEARRIVTMERKMSKMEQQQQVAQQMAQQQEAMRQINEQIAQVKQIYPNFDMDTEWQNPNFQRLVRSNVPLATAYEVCHKDEIIGQQARFAARQIQTQAAQTIASNKARPVENGIGAQAGVYSQPNFKGMSLKDIRAYADQQRRITGKK